MKKIYLSGNRGQGKYAVVDDEDFIYLNQFKWVFSHGYAVRNHTDDNNRFTVFMHREIMRLQYQDKCMIDHINRDRLDNRKINLRLCNRKENARNRSKHQDSKANFKGIYFHKKRKTWEVYLGGKYYGYTNNELYAAQHYDRLARIYYRDFGYLNFPNINNYDHLPPLKKRIKTSAHKGISWNKRQEKWIVTVTKYGKTKHIGAYATELEAISAKNKYIEDQNVLCGKSI